MCLMPVVPPFDYQKAVISHRRLIAALGRGLISNFPSLRTRLYSSFPRLKAIDGWIPGTLLFLVTRKTHLIAVRA